MNKRVYYWVVGDIPWKGNMNIRGYGMSVYKTLGKFQNTLAREDLSALDLADKQSWEES